MAVIWKIVSGLQADGIPDNDPVFDLAAEKSWKWIFRWELLGHLSDETRYMTHGYMGITERAIPERFFKEFRAWDFPGLNPNDHYHIQN